jgi:hypothetical protein
VTFDGSHTFAGDQKRQRFSMIDSIVAVHRYGTGIQRPRHDSAHAGVTLA